MREINILVTSAGRRCELIELLRRDSERLGLTPRIVTTDMSPEWSSACQISDKSIRVPRASHADYARTIESVLRDEGINLLVPTIDTELQVFADHRDEWEQRFSELYVVSHGPHFVRLCRDKAATMTALEALDIGVPRTYYSPNSAKSANDFVSWPLIGKPVDGSSSIGIKDIASQADFEQAVASNRLMIQEKVVGDEFTVNAYVGKDSEIKAIIPHRRVATRGGEVEKGIVEALEGIEEITARLVSAHMDIRGPFNLQLIRRADRGLAVFEINGRFGGGFPLAHKAGGYFTQWIVEEGLLDRKIKPAVIETGWRMMRHDRSVFTHEGD